MGWISQQWADYVDIMKHGERKWLFRFFTFAALATIILLVGTVVWANMNGVSAFQIIG